jgi:hypothetical protein
MPTQKGRNHKGQWRSRGKCGAAQQGSCALQAAWCGTAGMLELEEASVSRNSMV